MRNRSLDRLPFRSPALAAAVLVLAAVPGVAGAATFVVSVGGTGTVFVDQTSGSSTTTIHVGDTVQWNWTGGTHSTTSGTCTSGGYYGGVCTPDNQWDSGQHSTGYSFSHTFGTAGNFNYYCSIHQAMMQGLVKVQAVTTAPPTPGFRFSPTGPVVGTPVHFIDTSTGAPTSWSWDFGDGQVANVQSPSHSFAAAGTFTVTLSSTNAGGTNTASQSVTVAPGGPTVCAVDASTLCLSNGRFQVTAQWQKPDGSSGSGNAIALTADSGYFWFFDPSNIELIAKVLNACGINDDLWVFGAGLTNVKVILSVLDTSTGVSEQYVNPLGTAFAPIQDTAAFPTCP
ncbi:MAG TPA: PKD domain-containing protein [Thermoanaerobaculia bacterium]|jgi:PKD repeat protein|nr:PKD domain-containing protein [Thermoanaerobaculia bacterium]